MTTSGKPPIDEQAIDSDWESLATSVPRANGSEPGGASDLASAALAAPEERPIYGAGVPYGGDDRTEEVDPIAIDMPFAPEEPPTPVRAAEASPRPPASVPPADSELKAPRAELMLTELFDSTPPPSLEPPDPAAFSTSRPPPPNPAFGSSAAKSPAASSPWTFSRRSADARYLSDPARSAAAPSKPPSSPAESSPAARHAHVAEPAGSSGVVALPSINVLDSTFSRQEPKTPGRSEPPRSEPPRSEPPRFEPPRSEPPRFEPAVAALAAEVPELGASVEPAFANAGAGAEPEPIPAAEPTGQRQSVPTLQSVGNAETRQRPDTAEARAHDRAAAAAAEEVVRLPSEVATTRPPDVLTGTEGRSSPAAAEAVRRRASPLPPQAVLAAPPSTKTCQIPLPSVMLAADVEAEADPAAVRRALRAARQTVRIELPPGFGRPGSPILPGFLPASAVAAPESGRVRSLAARRQTLALALAGTVLFLLGLFLLLRPREGSLVVTALGPGHRAVGNVQIFVDGTPLCNSSPCRISGLTPGPHQLRATAPGLASAGEQSVEIAAGEEAISNIELATLEPDVHSGGMKVDAGEAELTLFVDDRRVGKLPQVVSGLPAGKHWIKLDPEDGSPAIEKAVTITAGEIIDVEPKPARRDKVVVTIRLSPESEGASVTLDDAFLLDFPAELELDPTSTHKLSATKPGYDDFSLDIELEEGEPEKDIEVSLTPHQGAAARRARPSSRATAARKAAAAKLASRAPSLDPSQGLLNISSVPPSQIILNGRPLGSTPKTAIVVPGDTLQTIVFVHPKMGRRRAQKFVPAGKERTVSIRF